MTRLMGRFLLFCVCLSLLCNYHSVTAFTASLSAHKACLTSNSGISVRANSKKLTPFRKTVPLFLRMSEEGKNEEIATVDPIVESPAPAAPIERKRSFFSRNVPEEKLNARKYFDIEERGEVLAGPDRAEVWGEELTEIGKWQRTKGPIYVQFAGLGFLATGFLDYFALGNINGSASPLFTLGIFSALLGIALQRKA
mmetsp:Transcript_34260/g.71969  ORF Transcript_34260/g.71969 Transcript_34260/m.71969 type:complete len:197 (-) Transcript_34260:276-866(-)